MMPAIKQTLSPHVLVIEDNELLQLIHTHTLELMGFHVTVVDHPQKAMTLWSNHWDLIFSDIGLPEMNGNELCRLRRAYEKQHNIHTPAFAYTAFGSTIREQCLSAGFDDFGVKPMDNTELQKALQKLLPQFELTNLKKFNA